MHIIKRYKLDVEVTDGQDTAKFVFWDSSLDQIVGLTAAALVEKQKKVSNLKIFNNCFILFIYYLTGLFNILLVSYKGWTCRPS
jgi:hypothetical protein